jgi:dTDP-4-dehydrorhamnose 3,5-epimerase
METDIPGMVIVEPAVFSDDRGWFMETFNEPRVHAELAKLGVAAPRPFVQDNHSCSRAGVLRGLHFQVPPHAQGKLVRVTQGAAWDVAVDIRRDSPTFGRWVGLELSAANRLQLWIPEDLAHGFLALQDDTHFLFKTTDVYAKDCERAIVWNDPTLAIDWQLNRSSRPLQIAEKDALALGFKSEKGRIEHLNALGVA